MKGLVLVLSLLSAVLAGCGSSSPSSNGSILRAALVPTSDLPDDYPNAFTRDFPRYTQPMRLRGQTCGTLPGVTGKNWKDGIIRVIPQESHPKMFFVQCAWEFTTSRDAHHSFSTLSRPFLTATILSRLRAPTVGNESHFFSSYETRLVPGAYFLLFRHKNVLVELAYQEPGYTQPIGESDFEEIARRSNDRLK